MSTLFLMWYDDTPKLPVARKIEDAIGVYRGRFGVAPTLALVNEEDVTEVAGVEVRGVTTVRRNMVWVGREGETPVEVVKPEPAKAPGRKRRVGA
jgi:hypothetical protein